MLKIKRKYSRLEKEDSRLPGHIKENGLALRPFNNKYCSHHWDGCSICLRVLFLFGNYRVLTSLIRNIIEIA